ncbi:hypothetical protein CVT26_013468, partial [Gymnopilus dilepis]
MNQNRVDREAVKRTLDEACKRIQMCAQIESPSEEMLELLSNLEDLLQIPSEIKKKVGPIEDAMQESWWKRLAEGDAQERIKCYNELSSSLNLFIVSILWRAFTSLLTPSNQMQTVVRIDRRIEDLKKTTEENSKVVSQTQADVKFQELRRVTKAEYNTGPRDLRGPCTHETREQILADLMAWATDDTKTPVYWLSGMAGTGKTTIAYSFCELLRKVGLLETSYFCSRSVAATMDPRAFLPTVSYHLASFYPSFSQSLLRALQHSDNVNIRDKIVQEQFHTLILTPMDSISSSSIRKRRVLVFDGADEASNMDEIADLISLLVKHAAQLPFKVFISSRRDEAIKLEFSRKDLASQPTTLILHDIEQSLVEADIRHYIKERLQQISDILSDSAVETLLERSGALFVYASVLCSYLVPSRRTPEQMMRRRLQTILDGSLTSTDGTQARPHDQLDKIYRQILSLPEENNDTWPVLLVILTTQIPLTATSISEILDFDKYRVSQVIEALQSVLTGSDLQEHPVTIFHTSFRDFLWDTSRGKEFSNHILANHDHLALQCLKIMKETLVCDRFPEVLRQDNNGGGIDIQPPSPRLAYACANWFTHLLELNAKQLEGLQSQVETFFCRLLLQWVECMSTLGYLENAVRSLRKFEISQIVPVNSRLAAMDARRMILQCFDLIQGHPSEIYNSALAWLPKASKMRDRFQSQVVWQVALGLQSDWGACESVMQGHSEQVWSVSFSPDGRRVASGSYDKTVRIWNIETGQEERKLEGHSDQEERKLEGHSDQVWSVSFSPNGRRVTSGSSDKT